MNLIALITTAGYIGIFAVIFAESGFLIGILLPGDSLLFTAGFLASQGHLNIIILIIITLTAAIMGDSAGYWLGAKLGPKIFSREDSLIFNRRHIQRTRDFYTKYGSKTIIIARFAPVIRTLAPLLAGVGSMQYSRFLAYNIVGGILWGIGLPLIGYFLGHAIPGIDRYILPIIGGILVLSALPTLIHVLRDPADRQQLLKFFRRK